MNNNEKIVIDEMQYVVLDSIQVNIPDSFVTNENKIGVGAGEAKLYIGNDSNSSLREFFGKNFILKCCFLKKDLVDYLNDLREEYFSPTQDYRTKEQFSKLWESRFQKIQNLSNTSYFKFQEQTQIQGNRIYGKSLEEAYNILREVSLPNFTNLQIYKLRNINSELIYYFKLRSIIQKDSNALKAKFIGLKEDDKNIVMYNNEIFSIENKKLGLSKNTIFDWGTISSNSINLSQAILFAISNDVNTSLTFYGDFLRKFLLQDDMKYKDKFELQFEDIKSWLDQKLAEIKVGEDNSSDNINKELTLKSIYPYDFNVETEELDIREMPLTPKEIAIRMIKGTLITDPDFQRNVVWSEVQKSQFIESIILNIPIPPIYLNESKNGTYIMIDGLQRSTAIKEFLDFKIAKYEVGNSGFKLQGLNALKSFNKKNVTELSEALRTRILDKKINCHIIKPSVPMSVVYDIFNRINTGGTQLTSQEIRNCVYIGPSTVLLAHLSEKDYFKCAIDFGVSSKRMKDKEVVLRYLAFQIFDYKEYNGNLDDFLGKTMQHLNTIGINNIIDFNSQDIFLNKNNEEYKKQLINNLINIPKINNLIKDFHKVMKLTFSFFGQYNFRLPTFGSRGRINVAVLESVSYFFSMHEESFLLKNKRKIQDNFAILLEDDDYQDSVKFSTGDKNSVITRFEKAIDILGEGIC